MNRNKAAIHKRCLGLGPKNYLNNEEKDILSNLEKDIDGDWKLIQEKIQERERKELEIKDKLKNPKRPNFPSFDSFYKLLVNIKYSYYSGNNNQELYYNIQELIYRFLNEVKEEKLPESIKKIWEVLCDPHRYSVHTTKCNRCNETYDVIYKYDDRNYYINSPLYTSYTSSNIQIERKVKYVYCPLCGTNILSLLDSDIISVVTTQETFSNT